MLPQSQIISSLFYFEISQILFKKLINKFSYSLFSILYYKLLIPIFLTPFFYKPDSCIIFYFILLKHGPSPCDLLRKLRKYDLEDMGRFLSDLLHEPSPCVLPSGQGTLVAPQAHRGGLVFKIFTSKEL